MPRASCTAEVEPAPISTPSHPVEPDRPPTKRSRDFDTFAAEIRREFAPASLIEQVLTDRVILAAWRLSLLSLGESASARAGTALPPMTRAVLRAESSLETALTVLRAARYEKRPRWGIAAPTDSKAGYTLDGSDHPDLSNEWPCLPSHDDTDIASVEVEVEDAGLGDVDNSEDADLHRIWRDRLTFDASVSDTSPVVKGTWVTAGHVVSLIVDGWTWSDILRTHPELTEDDVRACLAYTVAQDGCEAV
jgi:uncharacterized protein (DUF433 family)